jgi:lipopolysaccharide transport system ATP-binding protein
MNYAIQVEGLSKKYRIRKNETVKNRSVRDLLFTSWQKYKHIESHLFSADTNPLDTKNEDFWAIKDISFNVAVGDRLAIIGGNGAGKSTLLKILSGITAPTSGRLKIRGKVSSLLEVGTGFHPELTGRENIFLNGAILGMTRQDIRKYFDQIVSFSGVEQFIDTPVKYYSSGMYVRLAFSVSAWLNSEILIVDEVLSVGDQAFQKQCTERMQALTKDGRTIIFVSHSMAAVSSLCDTALYLRAGQLISLGPVEQIAAQYTRDVLNLSAITKWHSARFLAKDPHIKIESDTRDFAECIEGLVVDSKGDITAILPIEKEFEVRLCYRLLKQVPVIVVPNFHFYTEDGARFFISFPDDAPTGAPGVYWVTCKLPAFLFNAGKYSVNVCLSSFDYSDPVHFSVTNGLRFEVIEALNVDLRRHGFLGVLPGPTRIRLDWGGWSA